MEKENNFGYLNKNVLTALQVCMCRYICPPEGMYNPNNQSNTSLTDFSIMATIIEDLDFINKLIFNQHIDDLYNVFINNIPECSDKTVQVKVDRFCRVIGICNAVNDMIDAKFLADVPRKDMKSYVKDNFNTLLRYAYFKTDIVSGELLYKILPRFIKPYTYADNDISVNRQLNQAFSEFAELLLETSGCDFKVNKAFLNMICSMY